MYTVLGVLIGIVGAVINHYVKDIYLTEEKELEVEEQTSKLAEEN